MMAIVARVALALVTALCLGRAATAADFPDRPVHIIVPFPPGGATDLAARLVGAQLSTIWSQPVVVDNRSGASGVIGAEAAARAKPDGYTILMGTLATNVVAHLLQSDVPYGRDAFEPITLLASSPNILLANSNLDVTSLDDLVRYAKAHPGKVSYASAGVGLSGHLGVELFAQAAGIDLVHVPYRGSAPSGEAFVGGQVDLTLALVTEALRTMQMTKGIKPLAIAAETRSPQFPDTPTFKEVGYPNVEVYAINGFMAPKGTPEPIVRKIHEDSRRALQDPEVKRKMEQIGLDIVGSSPAEFQKFLDDEFARWTPLISANKAKFK